MSAESDLERRQRRERDFHDRWAAGVSVQELDPARLASCATTPETTYALNALGDIHERSVLDLGCGQGETAVWLALQGALVEAVDISPRMIEVASALAQKHGVGKRIRFHVAPGESLPFPDAMFDAVFGHDVLHHLDLPRANTEIKRVLAPRGTAVFAEPLGHNPVINHFRDISPETRTLDERALRFSDFAVIGEGFRTLRHREFQMSTLALFLWFYAVERADPNKVRYWKKIIVEADRYKIPFAFLNAIDRTLLAICPPLRRLCRMTVIVLER